MGLQRVRHDLMTNHHHQGGKTDPKPIVQQATHIVKTEPKKMNLVAPSWGEEAREIGEQRLMVNNHPGLQQ